MIFLCHKSCDLNNYLKNNFHKQKIKRAEKGEQYMKTLIPMDDYGVFADTTPPPSTSRTRCTANDITKS